MGELGIHFGRDMEEIWPQITIWKTSVMILEEFFRHDFGRDWESWEIILEEIWPQIIIWKTSGMILEEFFDI